MNSRDSLLRYLDTEFTEPIRDPLWKHIHLSPAIMQIVNCPAFHKLDRIKQLGIAYLVYPGATHTRLAHSLGVFHISRRLVRSLLGFTGLDFVTPEGLRAFLAAALLHDLGHFPFTHSLKDLPLRNHEALTAEYILSAPLAGLIKEALRTDPWTVAAIVDTSIAGASSAEVVFFRRLLSGILDPDKLDYLNRDAYFCGIPYGIQDVDFIINRVSPDPERGLAIDAQGVTAIENVLFSKYLMYRSVYWHRTVRMATAMIKKALIVSLLDGALQPTDLYGLDDEDFFHDIARRPHPAFDLLRRVASRDILKTAMELPFDEGDERIAGLLDLAYRTEVEARLATILSRGRSEAIDPNHVIIDIPEKISFDVDLPVIMPNGESLAYPQSGTVFADGVVDNFVRRLRVLRLALPRRVHSEAELREAFESSL